MRKNLKEARKMAGMTQKLEFVLLSEPEINPALF